MRKLSSNFTEPVNCRQAAFKLWVRYRPEHARNKSLPTKTYYSYDKAHNPEYGRNRLIRMVCDRHGIIAVAILYDNQSGRELQRYRFA